MVKPMELGAREITTSCFKKGPMLSGRFIAQVGYAVELGFSVFVRDVAQLLVVDAQGEAHLFEELGDSDGPVADLNARGLEFMAVVLLVHLHPVIGSPAVSCRISSSIRAMTCGVFFHRIAARPGATDPVKLDVLCQLDNKRLGNGTSR